MKQRLLNWLLKNVFHAVVVEDVLVLDKGVLKLGGKEIGPMELRSLIEEAKSLDNMRLWKILNETPKNQAFDTGWNKSTDLTHLNTGKTIYYTLDLQSSIVKTIRSQEKK